MTLEEIKIKSEQEWETFIEQLEKIYKKEIDKKNSEKKEEINKLKNTIEQIKSKTITIQALLDNSELISTIDNNISKYIKYLSNFKEDLDNFAAQDIFEVIVSKINITALEEYFDEETKKANKSQEITEEINKIINGENYNFDSINELCDSLQIDETKKRLILFYPIESAVLNKKVNKNAEHKNIKKTTEPIENKNKDIQKNIQIETKDNEKIEEQENDINPKLEVKLNEIMQKYHYVLSKYYEKCKNFTEVEISFYKKYAQILNSEHNTPDNTLETDDQTLAIVYYMQYRECAKEIEKAIQSMPTEKEKINEFKKYESLIEVLLNDMEKYCESLYNLDKELTKSEEKSKVFILNVDGETFIEKEVYNSKTVRNNFLKIIKKGEHGQIQNQKGFKIDKIDPEKIDNKEEYLESLNDLEVKNIKFVRNKNDSVMASYITLNVESMEIEDNYIYIIYATSKGIEDLINQTRKIIANKDVIKLIKKQTKQILDNDEYELQTQQDIKKVFSTKKKSVKQGDDFGGKGTK